MSDPILLPSASPWARSASSQAGLLRSSLRAGMTFNTDSGSVSPVIGFRRSLSPHFALGVYAQGDPRDVYLGGLLRPEFVVHPHSRVHASFFVEGGAGYFLQGRHGGTGGASIGAGLGAEICPQLLGAHAFCTAVVYNFNWMEPSVFRSMSSAITDPGWRLSNRLNVVLSLAFDLGS